MKRRQLIGYAGLGLVSTFATNLISPFQADAQSNSSLSIKWLGHTCFLFSGGGKKVLVNPFRTIGCTAGYRLPNVSANLVLISSQLLDEGAVENLPGDPKLVYQPGVYKFQGMEIQGISIDHDRVGGRRFGKNVAWIWEQAGVRILHLGGAAAPVSLEQKILIRRPDLVFVPVGGSEKAYNAQEAKQAVDTVNARIVVPTHYRTQAADENACDIVPVDDFLSLMQGVKVTKLGSDGFTVNSGNLPQNTEVKVLSYKF
ncbi:MAG: MBL fold metallo-hydrolase [Cyanobacteria bacterium P01_A01_bin.45]